MSHEALHRVLIAVELGAHWPPWLSDLAFELPRQVLSQAEGEHPRVFAERVVSAAGAEHPSLTLHSAILLCNERTDSVQQGARRHIADAIPGKLHPHAAGKVVLAAWAEASEKLRAALRSLIRTQEFKHSAPVARFSPRRIQGLSPRAKRPATSVA